MNAPQIWQRPGARTSGRAERLISADSALRLSMSLMLALWSLVHHNSGMSDEQAPAEPSEQHPFYKKVCERPDGKGMCMITVDEGWRQSILCTDIYPEKADWLIGLIQGKPMPAMVP